MSSRAVATSCPPAPRKAARPASTLQLRPTSSARRLFLEPECPSTPPRRHRRRECPGAPSRPRRVPAALIALAAVPPLDADTAVATTRPLSPPPRAARVCPGAPLRPRARARTPLASLTLCDADFE